MKKHRKIQTNRVFVNTMCVNLIFQYIRKCFFQGFCIVLNIALVLNMHQLGQWLPKNKSLFSVDLLCESQLILSTSGWV